MRGTPTRQWTCDKCGATAVVGHESAPKGWRHVMSEVLYEIRTGTDKQYDGHWCTGCLEIAWLLP